MKINKYWKLSKKDQEIIISVRFVLLLLLVVVVLSLFDFVRAQTPFEFTYPILSVQTGNVLYLRLKKITTKLLHFSSAGYKLFV
ncbi:hypothetical protein P5673_023066 [Acropora cervicornis]|uniref:Uncharacterized protein n=1 Tax=Acropora cervicornis TaxID=6130 RepID=A0AAD9UZB2_ACRCE|nr:hypothetical protein P5673_023066 [Acropora cervicornis]